MASDRGSDPSSAAAPTAHLPQCVMVVDDDASVRSMVRELCRQGGWESVEATSGRDALDRLKRGAAPSLILMELMDARQVWKQRMADPALNRIPVVVMSEGPFSEKELPGLAGVVAKPIGVVRVMKMIERHVRH
jgi:CheY-like chemotaxis protein